VVVAGVTVILAVLPPVFHRYELPPILLVAFKVTEVPVHCAPKGDCVIFTTGNGFTLTTDVSASVHPAVEPTTVYVVVEVGFAVTLAVSYTHLTLPTN
jgi:hypothetical protein